MINLDATRISLTTITPSCTDPPCGACCHGQAALPIHLVGSEHFRLTAVLPVPDWLRNELQAAKDKFLEHGFPPDDSWCMWFDHATKKCKHYEYRPELCRDALQPGDEACLRARQKLLYDKN